jgi:cyclic pyranopterin phosphate synthase
MPVDPVWFPREQMLRYEEITRLVEVFAGLGVSKIRVTGGEPLVRREIEKLIGMITQVPGIESIGLTTNGFLLGEKAASLRENGLKGATISLHSLKPERFEAVVKTAGVFETVLAGIEAAKEVGLRVKINCVVTRGCNEDEILDFAQLAYEGNVTVRFIEYMPFDGEKQWDMEKVVSGEEIIDQIKEVYELAELPRELGSTAQVYRFRDGSRGEVGVITSMTRPFCGDCDRVRLTCDGKIVPCMFSPDEYDLMPLLRGGASDQELKAAIGDAFMKKSPGVESMMRQAMVIKHVRPMHTIGG